MVDRDETTFTLLTKNDARGGGIWEMDCEFKSVDEFSIVAVRRIKGNVGMRSAPSVEGITGDGKFELQSLMVKYHWPALSIDQRFVGISQDEVKPKIAVHTPNPEVEAPLPKPKLEPVLEGPAFDGEAVSLFDGESLNGWKGDLKFWSVQDGCITGTTTSSNPTRESTYLIWDKDEFSNFELKIKFRIVGGNSGVQFRSKETGKWRVGGYQADFDAGNEWTGSIYEEAGRGVLSKRGQRISIDERGAKQVVGTISSETEIARAIHTFGDWNECTIVCRENQTALSINGLMTAELNDSQAGAAASSGILALQLHHGPPMTVQFKDILLRRLK